MFTQVKPRSPESSALGRTRVRRELAEQQVNAVEVLSESVATNGPRRWTSAIAEPVRRACWDFTLDG